MVNNCGKVLSLRCCLILVFAAASAASASFSGDMWVEDFESFGLGTIHNQDTKWYVTPKNSIQGAFGDVSDQQVHQGEQSLCVGAYQEQLGGYSTVKWTNDTGTEFACTEGNVIGISFWMYTDSATEPHWQISVKGKYFDRFWYYQEAACISTRENTDDTMIDVKNSGGLWTELDAVIPAQTWTRVMLEIDFLADPDVYRIRIGNGAWTDDWYAINASTNCEYFDCIEFNAWENGETQFYIDDFSLAVVPEPVSILLLGIGGLFAAKSRRG